MYNVKRAITDAEIKGALVVPMAKPGEGTQGYRILEGTRGES